MKKLNNKGMTSVEILISFVVVVMISISMYTTVSAYQNKQQVESFKEKIMTYKNLLTKEVNDDLIKKGLIAVDVQFDEANGRHTISFTLKNGQTKRMIITNVKASSSVDDNFSIEYGDKDKEIYYPVPNVGEYENDHGKKEYDLKINMVEVSTENSVFSLVIGFIHPDLESKYNITIVCPINF